MMMLKMGLINSRCVAIVIHLCLMQYLLQYSRIFPVLLWCQDVKNPYKSMVRARGFEPPRDDSHWILSPARLPVPPRPHLFC